MALNLLMACEELEIAPRFVLHDRDKLLAWDFDAVLTTSHSKVVKTPFRAPDANAHAERWVRSVTGECLEHLILFGLSSLQRALRVYCDFFNGHRPHRGIANRIPERRATEMSRDCAGAMTEGDLAAECEQFPSTSLRAGLGGLLNSYYRKAAQSAPDVILRRETPGPASPPALSVARSEPLTVTPAPASEAGWCHSVGHRPIVEPACIPCGKHR